MALPSSIAGSLVKDMAAKGLGGGKASVGDAPMEAAPALDAASDDPGGLDLIQSDIDKLQPGLGALIQEYVERALAERDDAS